MTGVQTCALPISDNYDPKQLDIWGDLPKKRSITYIGKKVLDSEYFNQLKQDPKLLGKILWQNTDMGPFEDLRMDLFSAYHEGYNRVVLNDMYKAASKSIENVFGRGTWEEHTNQSGRERSVLMFDITNLFWSLLNDYYSNEVSKCKIPDNKSKDLDWINENCDFEEPFEQVSNFIEFYREMVDPKFNPSFDDYAYGDELISEFFEAIQARI